MKAMSDSGALLGRILMALIFVGGGAMKFANPAFEMDFMAKAGFPAQFISSAFYLAAIIELVGGIMLIVGWRTRLAAAILFLYLIPTTVIFHLIPHEQIQVLKNLAIMGGLLLVVAQGPGGLVLDRAS